MTIIQQVNYLHMRYLENNWKGDIALKMECAREIQLKDWGINDGKQAINANGYLSVGFSTKRD
jgi:hypothetical protein